MPWLIAAFLVMVLCTPFDSTELRVSLPVDAKLDRLMIVVMTVAWIGSMFAGGVTAPRWRRSPVNVALLAFVGVAVLSLVVNVSELVQQDETNLGLRRLSILLSWAVFFCMVATSIRPGEIRAFIKLLIAASCVLAVGVMVQYWGHRNLFFEWWSQLVPQSVFELRSAPRSGSPFVGDPVTGPMTHALGLATVMAIALAYTVAGLVNAARARSRVLYAIAAALMLLAVFATGRKTGGFATVAMLAALTALRPRQVLRFLPIAIVVFGLTFAARPQAVERQLQQLNPAQVASDASGQGRTEDYPAITPDVRERVLLGKGYGTYDPAKYRILDNEALVLVVEVGLIGLAGFYGILLMVGLVARRPARSRDATIATAGMGGAGAAAALAMAALLFDTLGFPAPEYVFFFAAGLTVVAAHAARVRPAPAAVEDPLERLAGTLEGRPLPEPLAEPVRRPRFDRPVGEPVEPGVPIRPLAQRQAAREHGGGRARAAAQRLLGRRFPRSTAAGEPGPEDGRTAGPAHAGRFARRSGQRDRRLGDAGGAGAAADAGHHRGRSRPSVGIGAVTRGARSSRTVGTALVALALAVLLGRGGGDSRSPAILGQARGGKFADPFAYSGGSRPAKERPARPARAERRHAPAERGPVLVAQAPVAAPPPAPPAPQRSGPPAPRPKPRPQAGRPHRPRPPEKGGSQPGPGPSPADPVAQQASKDCLPGDVDATLQAAGVDPCILPTGQPPSADALGTLADDARRAHAEGRLQSGDLERVLRELAALGGLRLT